MIKKHIGTITDEITGVDDILVIVFCDNLNIEPESCEFIIHGGITDVYQIIRNEMTVEEFDAEVRRIIGDQCQPKS